MEEDAIEKDDEIIRQAEYHQQRIWDLPDVPNSRSQFELAFINSAAKRRVTYRRRAEGVLNKAKELKTLCGVDTCAVIYNPHEYEPKPKIWPNTAETNTVLAKFRNQPEIGRRLNMVDQKEYAEQELKKKEKLEKLKKVNKNKMARIMHQWSVTGEVPNFSLEDLKSLKETVDQAVNDMCTVTISSSRPTTLPMLNSYKGVRIG